MTWALLPLKDLSRSKTRLSGVLAPHERRALTQAMVEDVLEALIQCRQLQGVLLVSDDPCAQLLAPRYGVDTVSESQLASAGLNGAVRAGTAYLAERGVSDVMVLHGDIPLLSAVELDSLLAHYKGAGNDILLGSDEAGTGTNVMVFPVSRPPQFSYGVGSLQAHQHSALALGLEVQVMQRPGAALDVDSPADLLKVYHAVRAGARATHTAALLLDEHIAERLDVMELDGLGAARE
jgi:2-phospho-L-lactate guanylyltransferase